MIPIEDFHEDIIGKVIRGRGLSIGKVASDSGLTTTEVQSLLDGAFDEAAVRAVAPVLNLDPDALVASAQKAWRPEPIELDGLAIFNTPWHDMRVNAFLVWDPDSRQAAAFDTGADATGMIDFIADQNLRVAAIYLTHTHGDHIADLDKLSAATGKPPVFVNPREALDGTQSADEGHSAEIGALRLSTRLTSGHSVGGNTYLVDGLARPVAIVGDSLFAGSMGGGKISFEDALANNRGKILTLPDNTVLCPGHGPMTSVAEEKAHNPFFAGG